MIKIGVVGVGHLGQHHVRKFQTMEHAELVGIYDAKPERAKEIADKLGVRSFADYDSLLDAIDAIDIAATTTHHYALAKPALQKGKHVFLEKPITTDMEQANELIALAKEKNLLIQVGHIERFNPVILKVEQEIKDPLFIESHRLSTFHHRGTDVPVVLDLMIHDIDLILDFVKSPITDIRASGIGILTSNIDIANARLEFASGAIANVTSSRVSLKQERKIRFFQKDAYFSMDFVAKQVSVVRKSPNIFKLLPQIMMGATDIKAEDLVDMKLHDASVSEKDALQMELESFVEAIRLNKKPIVDGEAGARALSVALEIISIINKQIKDNKGNL